MSDKTPPAWAIEVGRTIAYDFGEPRYQEAGIEVASMIVDAAPDAESLAVALEELRHITWEMKQDIYQHEAIVKSVKKIDGLLATHRARFPKE